MFLVKVKFTDKPSRPSRPERILVSVAQSNKEYFYFPLGGMLVHCRAASSIRDLTLNTSSMAMRMSPNKKLNEEAVHMRYNS